MHLTKHHVFGNDFLVRLEAGRCPVPARLGAGSLRTAPVGSAPTGSCGRGFPAAPGEVRRTWLPAHGGIRCAPRCGSTNADGGEAEVSGNGLACLAQAMTLRAGRDEAEAVIATVAGARTVSIGNTRFADADDAGDGFGPHPQPGRHRPGAGERGRPARPAVPRRRWRSWHPSTGAPAGCRSATRMWWRCWRTPRPWTHLPLEAAGAALQERFEPVNFEAVAVADGSHVRMRVFERGVGDHLRLRQRCWPRWRGGCASGDSWRRRWKWRCPAGRPRLSVGSGVELRVPVIYVADVRGSRARSAHRRRFLVTDPARDRRAESHRGAFGEFGGEAGGFIDRAFREQIVLVGVATPALSVRAVEESLEELARLVDTAGADPVQRVIQRRDRIDPATYVGRGKAQEIRDIAEQYDADTVVFDDELSAAQQYNLEGILGRTAIDRTTVILDIFAQNASSTEGKVQVELAQLRYRLPRLRGSGYRLSQQAGGIGHPRARARPNSRWTGAGCCAASTRLEGKLRGIRRHRGVQARRRQRSAQSTVAIVGYTNAGKSSLLNALCDSEGPREDRLFATLDALTRRLDLPGGETVLLVDTVGFVRKLPHEFVEAFMSTLEVAVDADLLVHVVDASAADCDGQLEAGGRCWRSSARRRCPSCWSSTSWTPPTGSSTCWPPTRAAWRSRRSAAPGWSTSGR